MRVRPRIPARRDLRAAAAFVLLLLTLMLGGSSAPTATVTIPATMAEAAAAEAAAAEAAAAEAAAVEAAAVEVETLSVDVLVYGSTTAGIGALHAVDRLGRRFGRQFSLALIAPAAEVESPLAQGLSVEDVFRPQVTVSGFYDEFRRGVLSRYAAQGIDAARDGRLRYEPRVAQEVLRSLLPQSGLRRLSGRLVQVEPPGAEGLARVLVESGTGARQQVEARLVIDASPEGDLGRALGADYMMGTGDAVFNDVLGPAPAPPGPENGFSTAPQSLSMLLTLRLHPGGAPPLAQLTHPLYQGSTYGPDFTFGENNLLGFADSWSMRQVLPNDRRELNQAWSDYRTPADTFAWVMRPDSREALRARMATAVLDKVRYLQEHGYPHVGVDRIPEQPYVRAGVRFRGEDFYSGADVDAGIRRQSVAFGRYARYDRHDPAGAQQISAEAAVHVPMGALVPRGFDYLLAPTAVSSDESAYSSAVRMESVRGNMGAAAGVMAGLALIKGTDVKGLSYDQVSGELRVQGHALLAEEREGLPAGQMPSATRRLFWDVPASGELYHRVTHLNVLSAVSGRSDRSFGPAGTALRAQVAKMVVEGYELGQESSVGNLLSFIDLPNDGAAYPQGYVQTAVANGLLRGYRDGRFGPWEPMTRVQLVRVLVRAEGSALAQPPAGYDSGFRDVAAEDRTAVARAHFNGLVQGRNATSFDPYAPASRGHVALILGRSLSR